MPPDIPYLLVKISKIIRLAKNPADKNLAVNLMVSNMDYPNLTDAAAYGNLVIAHANAKRGKTHYRAVEEFEANKECLLRELSESLLNGAYKTSPYTNKTIIDGGKERLISKLPYYPDRIAHWALMLQLEPEFMRRFSENSHAAISGHGSHSALSQVRDILRQYPEHSRYCLKIDIKKYFPNIDHVVLKEFVAVLSRDTGIIERMNEIIDSFDHGIPIGNYTSQFLANYYLTELDNLLECMGALSVRYMDDICIFAATPEEARRILTFIRGYLTDRLHVEIKSNWQIFPVAVRGVDFVGYRIFPNRVLLRKSTFRRLRRRLIAVSKRIDNGHISSRDMSIVASYAGNVHYCTPNARHTIYINYFEKILTTIINQKYANKIKRVIL